MLFHGDDFFGEGHDRSLDRPGEGRHSRSSACLRMVLELVEKVSFCRNESGFLFRPDSKHVDASRLCRWKMRDLLQQQSHVTLEREDKPTLSAGGT